MKHSARLLWLGLGLILGVAATVFLGASPRPVWAYNDRLEDYIIATGPVTTGPQTLSDGVWMLDYRAGKLLGTIIDRMSGKVHPWADVDLLREFNLQPKQNVRFMMTTGSPIAGQTALYITEINSGRFGVYTMGPRADGRGLAIRRHDATSFRQPN